MSPGSRFCQAHDVPVCCGGMLKPENGIMPSPYNGACIGITLDYDLLEAVTLSKKAL